jgi:hypothetical protein
MLLELFLDERGRQPCFRGVNHQVLLLELAGARVRASITAGRTSHVVGQREVDLMLRLSGTYR